MVCRDYNEEKKLTFILPLSYLMDNNDYKIHVVMFIQLRPSLKATDTAMHENPFFLTPCMPIKAIDTNRINTDFANSLQLMYYNQEPQNQLYGLTDVHFKTTKPLNYV